MALSIGALACEPDLGACDMDAARTVVYDVNGSPAYEGQAYIIETCGSGSFCHSADIEPELRFGASRGLEFDLQLAGETPESADRLGRSQVQTHVQRHAVYEQIARGAMPPPGSEEACPDGAAPGVPCGFSLGSGYERIPDGETSGTPLPSIRSVEAQAILRNWLACDAPVIERTTARTDGFENAVGVTEPEIDRPLPDNTWGSIYAGVIAPSCARSKCHDAASAEASLDLSSRERAYEQLLMAADGSMGRPASGVFCGDPMGLRDAPRILVVPGDPEASLLLHKLRGFAPTEPLCGEDMPSGRPRLPASRVGSIEAWIMAGAPND